MKKKSAQIDINLIPKDPFYNTVLGRVLQWALSAGRYIIIFTELVVIISFATRFTLDRQLTDLNSEILVKQSIVNSYGDLESNFRAVQAKTIEYQKISLDEPILDNFTYMSQVTPNGVSLNELVIRNNGIVASGTTLSQTSFNLLINNLQLSPHFTNVTIDKIESIEENNPGLAFRLRANTAAPVQVINAKETQ